MAGNYAVSKLLGVLQLKSDIWQWIFEGSSACLGCDVSSTQVVLAWSGDQLIAVRRFSRFLSEREGMWAC